MEPIHGRGASASPGNRFESLHYSWDADLPPEERPAPATQFLRDQSRSIIATNDSPDVGFDASINPYRGCEHGCIYCYARPTHEYLGFSAGLDFETKIMVKENAAELLRKELLSPRWKPRLLALSGVTDCYQPIERKLQLTRRCLQVLAEFRNPVAVVTKNQLVTRDVDLLGELARHTAAAVCVSVTTLDAELARRMEPRTTQPAGRLKAIRILAQAKIPVRVLIAPLIPGLTDHEMPQILEAAADAGASAAGYVVLRLPFGLKGLFEDWLTQHYPDKKARVLGRLRELRDGELYRSRWGSRMRGEGTFADLFEQIFDKTCRRLGFQDELELSTAAFRRPNDTPQILFE